MTQSVAEHIVDFLEASGIQRIHALPGEENLSVVEALRTSGIDVVVHRHEQNAAFTAEAEGRLSGRPGVCLATLGPGATNLFTGLAHALLGGSPPPSNDSPTPAASACWPPNWESAPSTLAILTPSARSASIGLTTPTSDCTRSISSWRSATTRSSTRLSHGIRRTTSPCSARRGADPRSFARPRFAARCRRCRTSQRGRWRCRGPRQRRIQDLDRSTRACITAADAADGQRSCRDGRGSRDRDRRCSPRCRSADDRRHRRRRVLDERAGPGHRPLAGSRSDHRDRARRHLRVHRLASGRTGTPAVGSVTREPRPVGSVAGVGATAARVASASELAEALGSSDAQGGLHVIECPIDYSINDMLDGSVDEAVERYERR